MATKNTLFTVDITKENPLITIIKNGKIPVVRFGKTGFQNFKQEKYFKNHSEEVHKYKIERGCFVHIGGVQGSYISGGHWGENLNIGYIEPEDDIFVTYSYTKSNFKNFSFMKAKDRLKNGQESYKKYMLEKESKHYSLDDFDIYVEAIVDSRKIKKVLTLEPKNFHLLIPYVNDGYFCIYDMERIYYSLENYLPQDFWNHIDFSNKKEEDYTFSSYNLNELKYFNDFWDIQNFKNIILEEFSYYMKYNKFLRDNNYYKKLKQAFIDFNNFQCNIYKMFEDNELKCLKFLFTFLDNSFYLNLGFSSYGKKNGIESISFDTNSDKIIIRRKNDKYYLEKSLNWNRKNYQTKESEYIYETINLNETFKNKYRQYIYYILHVHKEYNECFHKFFEIKKTKFIEDLEKFYNVEQYLKKNYSYKFKDDFNEFYIETDNFLLEYNIVLQDGIINIPNSEKIYYNLDNLPQDFNKEKLNEILSVLKKLDT